MKLHSNSASCTGASGATGLPPIFCSACLLPLHRELYKRIARAAKLAKVNQSNVRCLRPGCNGRGTVDLQVVLFFGEVIELQEPARRARMSPGPGRPVKPKCCTVCGGRGTARW